MKIGTFELPAIVGTPEVVMVDAIDGSRLDAPVFGEITARADAEDVRKRRGKR